MRPLILYSAVSLNGYIARPDGEVDWLETTPNPEQLHYGYNEFYAGIGVTLQGANTYRKVEEWGVAFPYTDKENYVFSRDPEMSVNEYVTLVHEDPVSFVRRLKAEPGPAIWLVGGGQLNALLLEAGLVDEVQLFVMPVTIPDGIPLFGGLNRDVSLPLRSTRVYPTGVIQLVYAQRPGLLLRSSAANADFVAMVTELDAYLTVTDGDEHDFYDQYNKLDDIHHVIIAYVDGVAVACGAIKVFDGDRMEVKRMYTRPDHRGRGHAGRILAALENWTVELGYRGTILETGHRQTEAVAFYHKVGYQVIPNYGQYRGVENSICFGKELVARA